MSEASRDWPLWEVFVRANRGLSHVHVGSLHAPDAEMAVRNGRDLYTRRGEGVSIWVVPERGALGIGLRLALVAAYPLGLVATGALRRADLSELRALWKRRRRLRASAPADELDAP